MFEAVREEKSAVVVLLKVVQLRDELVDKHAEKRLLRSCPNCELSEAMSRANHSAMQVA